MIMNRLVFHVDVNSAFLSWESARRVKEGSGPDLRAIPAIIGGDPEKRTSVVLAESIPAKKFQIRTGEPVSMALRKCPDLVIAPPDFRLYQKCSHAFKDICRSYAPAVEEFSIDELFMDMSGTELVYPDPIRTAHEINDKIRDTLGFTVNIGIAPNKLLAKMASDFEKPDRVHTLFQEEIPGKLWPLPVGELFSVGGATAEKLVRAKILTIGDLAAMEPEEVQKLVGKKGGKVIWEFANGIDESPVASAPREMKGYSISTTFEEDLTGYEPAEQILRQLVDHVTARMRRDGFQTECVTVSIRSNTFKNQSHQQKLYNHTDITDEIFRISKSLLRVLWDGKMPLRLMGVYLTGITHDSFEQLSLFDDRRDAREKQRKADAAMDSIREKFGTNSIVRGSTMKGNSRIGKKFD